MDAQQIETTLRDALELDEVHAKTDGSHAQVIAVGEIFAGLSPVKKQQLIYGPLNHAIADGSIHALSIKAYTPEEWRRDKLLQPAP